MDSSPKPKLRPKTIIPYDDIEKIERVVWGEARGEGVEGRDAVRGVILNRLASDRFPDTIDEILSEDQFEPVATYGDIFSIPAPEDDLNEQIAEFADYVQLGQDAVDGRTFFQNMAKTKKRGTKFDGPDPIIIGNHTFTRGYRDQEPVYDTNFSHNVEVVFPEYAASEFSLGGLAEARKGIKTKAGYDMAKKKFQLDMDAADIDGDGELSEYEEQRGEAIQKAQVDAEVVSDEVDADEKYAGMNCGGMMGPVDPVSGNPIPPGSTAKNVRDDIPAWLSEGEYVLPADVVKWHGLKHIMDMQEEAKMGLMMMTDMGLIVETDDTVCPECGGEGCEYCEAETCDNCPENGCADCPMKASGEEVKTETTPDGNEIEFPEVEVTEENIIEGEEEPAEDEMYGKEEATSMFGMVKKPKITFIV